MSKAEKPFIATWSNAREEGEKSFVEKMADAVGCCPVCKKMPTWFNDIPLKAYCWGTEKNEHEEMVCEVPAPHQPYGKGKKKAKWQAG